MLETQKNCCFYIIFLLFYFVLFLIHIGLIKETEMNRKMKFNVGQPYIDFSIINVQYKKIMKYNG